MIDSEATRTPPGMSSSLVTFPPSNDPNRASFPSTLEAAPTPPSSSQHAVSSPTSQDYTQQMSFTDYIEWHEARRGNCHERVGTEERNTSGK